MKKFIAATALVATLGVAGSTVAGTAAFANGGSDGNGHKNDQQSRSNRSERRHGNDSAKDLAVKKVTESHMKARHLHKGWILGRHWLIRTAADAIGIDASALRAQLREGKSIAEVATANDVDPNAVVAREAPVESHRRRGSEGQVHRRQGRHDGGLAHGAGHQVRQRQEDDADADGRRAHDLIVNASPGDA
jgi:hypothetical protein